MIIGIGCDIVENNRFSSWVCLTYEKLRAVFTDSEITQLTSLSTSEQKVLFLASRFAAKEAFYKALSSALISLAQDHRSLTFAFTRKAVSIEKHLSGAPNLVIDWQAIAQQVSVDLPAINSHISLSHEASYSCAFVTIEASSSV